VDNDGNVELVAGSLGGMLLVWKGTNPQPWRTSENLGTVRDPLLAMNMHTFISNMCVVLTSHRLPA
jgi:hypothetical protein